MKRPFACSVSSRKSVVPAITALIWICITAVPSTAVQPTFLGLGDLPGGQYSSNAFGVSGDGSVVVGISNSVRSSGAFEGFRWTAETGMVGLGSLGAPENYTSLAYDVSSDGSVIVGNTSAQAPPNYGAPFRWTASEGLVPIGPLPGGEIGGTAYAISADGRTIVGYAGNAESREEAFRWTAETGMIGLGDLPGAPFISSVGLDVSGDGSVVVGVGTGPQGEGRPFRWTEAAGMIDLGDLPGGGTTGGASGVSLDGSIIVGSSRSTFGEEAFLWTESTGMVGLGDLPGGPFGSGALDVSADGKIVVGNSCVADLAPGFCFTAPFVWDAEHGMRNLQTLLTDDFGLDLTGWQLFTARAISADGLTIVGYGWNPNRRPEAYLARIPEPTTAALLLPLLFMRAATRRTSR